MSANRDRLAAAPQALRAGYTVILWDNGVCNASDRFRWATPATGFSAGTTTVVSERSHRSGLQRASLTRPLFATASRQNKNLDSIGDKVTRLILQDFFDFSALRIGNTTSNIEAKSIQASAGTSDR